MRSDRWLLPILTGHRQAWGLLLSLLGLLIGLHILGWILPSLTTVSVLLVWVGFWLALWLTLFWRRRLWRRLVVQAVVQPNSRWQARLARGWMLAPGQGLVAAGLALALVLSLTRGIPATTWVLLVLLLPFWVFGWYRAQQALARHLRDAYVRVVTGQLLHRLNGWFLLLALTLMALWQDLPDLRSASLFQAMAYYSLQYQLESDLLSALMITVSSLDGVYHWLVQQLGVVDHGWVVTLLAWMSLLVREALFVWPWLYLCQGIAVLYQSSRGDRGHDDPKQQLD